MASGSLERVLGRAEALYRDLDYAAVQDWKGRHPGGKAIGYLPVYAPRELVHAAGMLPVAIRGGGDQVEIVRGDACYQSYICHLPRSVVELAMSGKLAPLDGFLFPAICDVIRNLSGMWQILFPDRYVRYLDLPQCLDPSIGGEFWLGELARLRSDLERLGGKKVTDGALAASIAVYNQSRRAVLDLMDLRNRAPWLAPTHEVHLVLRAGDLLPPEEHRELVREYLVAAEGSGRRPLDQARVVLVGAFCEQPPLGLLAALTRAGCAIVADDLTLVHHWHAKDIPTAGDPLENLALAYLLDHPDTASVFSGSRKKGEELVLTCRRTAADGVLFASPSFCDPSLLDRPMLAAALAEAGIPYTDLKYAENTAQFTELAEQAGTFSDTLKLWSEDRA